LRITAFLDRDSVRNEYAARAARLVYARMRSSTIGLDLRDAPPEIANAASLRVGFESDLELDAAFATVDSDSDSDGTDDD
jgi:hypothetical protein